MRTVLAIALLLLFCGVYTVAQDYPKAEVFGGFSMLHPDTEGATVPAEAPTGTSIKHWYPGWEVAGQYNLTKLLGIKADFSGNYGKPVSSPGISGLPSARTYSFLFGPVVSFRGDRITPFIHAGLGANHISTDASTVAGFALPATSDTAFAMAFGGGVDVKLTHHFSWRVGQFDYVYTKHDICAIGSAPAAPIAACEAAVPPHQNNFHFATGIVIH